MADGQWVVELIAMALASQAKGSFHVAGVQLARISQMPSFQPPP